MPGGRPTKPLALVQGHRTKAEKATREQAEATLITGTSIKEWPDTKSNPVAHREFNRLKKLLKSIGKDDGLFEAVINDYCLLISECKELESKKEKTENDIKDLEYMKYNSEIAGLEYLHEKGKLEDRVMAYDKKIMEKRKMRLDIEKENLMTIQSALRSIPKKPEANKESPMAAFLKQRQANSNGT